MTGWEYFVSSVHAMTEAKYFGTPFTRLYDSHPVMVEQRLRGYKYHGINS